jgi:hypothetical protein
MNFKEIVEAVNAAKPSRAFDLASELLGKYPGTDLELITGDVYEVAARRIKPVAS